MGRLLQILLATLVVSATGVVTAASQQTPASDIALRLEDASPEMRQEVAALVCVLRQWEIDELASQRTIGTDNLWPGEWGLEVRITDELSGVATTREAAFSIVE